MIKNVIFDFDGTLADSLELILATNHRTIAELGLPSKTDNEIKACIGLKLEEAPAIFWPGLKDVEQPFVATYRRVFNDLKDRIPVTLFPGVADALSQLKNNGCRLSIATSRSRASANELTEKLGIKDCFDIIIGGDDVENGKPHPEAIYKILTATGAKPEETMMVGDMGVDVAMGKAAGASACGVTWGNGFRKDLEIAGADMIVDSMESLGNIVNS